MDTKVTSMRNSWQNMDPKEHLQIILDILGNLENFIYGILIIKLNDLISKTSKLTKTLYTIGYMVKQNW